LKEDQIAAIRNGESDCESVESRTPDEVFVFGSVYVRSTPENISSSLRTWMSCAKLPSYLAIRKFNDHLKLSDLDGFTLEADDIKQLKSASRQMRRSAAYRSDDAFKQSVNWSRLTRQSSEPARTEDGASSN